MSVEASLQSETMALRASARALDPDRYAASLFAPAQAREDLIVLAAFTGEIARVAQVVHEPMIGEVRLKWWSDAIAAGLQGQKSGAFLADAFADVARRRGLPASDIETYLDAHALVLYPAPPDGEAQLQQEFSAIDGKPFEFAARILNVAMTPENLRIIAMAAQAFGSVRIARDLPYSLARGRLPLPRSRMPESGSGPDWPLAIASLAHEARRGLDDIRGAFQADKGGLRTASLIVALIEPYLRALKRRGHDPVRDIAEIAPMTRLWRLAQAHWTGRI